MTITLSAIQAAINILANNTVELDDDLYRVPVSELQDTDLIEIATLSTPEHLDKGDIYKLFSEPSLVVDQTDRDTALSTLRSFLDYPLQDPEGVSLDFVSIQLENNATIAVTRIAPDNLDPSKDPIVFAGGLFHPTPVYLDLLSKLARNTGRKIVAYDMPGVGGSRFDDKAFNYDMWADSLPIVIKNIFGPEQSVIVMGHSLGTLPVRDLYYRENVEGENVIDHPVSKYVLLAPVPSLRKEWFFRGNHFALPYMLDGIGSMLHSTYLTPGDKAQEFYGQLHTDADWQWLEERIADEKMPSQGCHGLNGVWKYLGVLGHMFNKRLWGELPENDKLKYVLMEDDHVFVCDKLFRKQEKVQERWATQEAEVIEGADHSAIAGPNISDAIVDQIAEIIEGGGDVR
ncbi:MAG: hypothetical protein ACD_62C00691G0016 [uncultured bacterium]|nr:MAG: hypothetical protein ACD_62C00691G0016 [uncultured bacterium]